MSRPEAQLWDYLRARMPVGTHYSRIESLETAPGFPDIHYTLQGHSGTLELKHQPEPTGSYPFEGTRKGLRKSQRDWIRAELIAGGRVILGLQAGGEIYFLQGKFYKALDHFTLSDIAKAASLVWKVNGTISVPALAEVLTGYY